jgi:hypothetical protein
MSKTSGMPPPRQRPTHWPQAPAVPTAAEDESADPVGDGLSDAAFAAQSAPPAPTPPPPVPHTDKRPGDEPHRHDGEPNDGKPAEKPEARRRRVPLRRLRRMR